MRWPQTFILLAILLFLIQFIGATWVEGAGGVQGGPYWNEKVYRQQQRQRMYEDRREGQRTHMNTLQMQRYQQETQRRQINSVYKRSRNIKQTPSSSWNYRRANE